MPAQKEKERKEETMKDKVTEKDSPVKKDAAIETKKRVAKTGDTVKTEKTSPGLDAKAGKIAAGTNAKAGKTPASTNAKVGKTTAGTNAKVGKTTAGTNAKAGKTPASTNAKTGKIPAGTNAKAEKARSGNTVKAEKAAQSIPAKSKKTSAKTAIAAMQADVPEKAVKPRKEQSKVSKAKEVSEKDKTRKEAKIKDAPEKETKARKTKVQESQKESGPGRRKKSSAPDIAAPVSAAEIQIIAPELAKPEEPQIFDFEDQLFTKEPVAAEHVTEEITAVEVVEEPAAEVIKAEDIPAEEIAAEEPAAEVITAEDIPAEEIAAEEPAAEEIAAEEPAPEEITAEEITAEEPVEEIVAEEPAAEVITAEEIPAEEMAAEEPTPEEIPAEEIAAEEIAAEEVTAEVVTPEEAVIDTAAADIIAAEAEAKIAAEKAEAEAKKAAEKAEAEAKKAAEKAEKAAIKAEEKAKKAAAKEKAAEEKAVADKKAAEEKAVADKKAAEEKAIADKKAAEEKAVAAEKKAEEKAEKAAARKKDKEERKVLTRRKKKKSSKRERIKRARRKRQRTIAGNIVSGFFAAVAVLIMFGMGYGANYVYGFVKDLPTHNLDEIEASLKVLSTIYDDEGNEMKDIFYSDSRREIVTYDQIPKNLINAMVAIEDKTFWQHKGFNITRMIGAMREAYIGGGEIQGTSTITQQLARNIWLAETRSEYSFERKMKEAWFARELEQNLSKEEILTHYLNMVALGNHSYGVAAAAKLYFNKDLGDLDLLECAALAALPQSPSKYSMIITIPPEYVDPNDPDILLKTDEYVFLYNEDALPRIQLVLDLMLEQGYITKADHHYASHDNIRRHLHPQPLQTYDNSSFFIEWMIKNVAEDLVRTYPNDFEDIDIALQMVYSGGLEIYSTYSQRIQDIATDEFDNPNNYPLAYLVYDRAGNALGDDGEITLFSYNNMFVNRAASEENQALALEGEDPDAEPTKYDLAGIGEPWFKLGENDFEILPNGAMRIFSGKDKRLGIYRTSGSWGEDISVEFKDFFTKPPGSFYIIKGGKVHIPKEYKSMDREGNLILDPEFFKGEDNIFEFVPFVDNEGVPTEEIKENGATGEYWISPDHFRLEQPVIQPQAAAVIMEYDTGQVKAMIGGRGIEGSMQYNRALSPRQPGSTMKPISVYGPALQKTAEGIPVNDPEESFGRFWTPASVIYDEELVYAGKIWPKNWYRGYRGPVTMRKAIEQSINVCAVRAQLAVGNQRSVEFLKKLGITTVVETGSPNDMNPAALALGGMTYGIKPIELAAAYATFPNEGEYIHPIGYTKVLYKNGDVLLDGTPQAEQVMDPGAAFIMNDMLRTTVSIGISNFGRIPGMVVAGKTGTTSDRVDAWFVGSVNKYTAAVWVGSDNLIEMSQGSAAAGYMFSKVMARVCEGMPTVEFPEKPANVEMGSVGGLTDYFIIGTKPTSLSFGKKICLDSGYLATPLCPNTERRVLRPLNGNQMSLTPEELAAMEEGIPIWYCPLHNDDPFRYPTDPMPELPPQPSGPEAPPPTSPSSPQLCAHGSVPASCTICNPPKCAHGNIPGSCTTFNPPKCSHGNDPSTCSSCNGPTLCGHGNDPATCSSCNGPTLCSHGNDPATCTSCNPPPGPSPPPPSPPPVVPSLSTPWSLLYSVIRFGLLP